jgi:RNA polymerase sigma-70 factor (ECF subfamily)
MAEHSQTEIWVVAAQGGDRLALAKLLTTYHWRFRRRAESRMDAALKVKTSPDDVLQEVYLEVARHIARFEDRGPGSFLNWVYTILDRKIAGTRRAAHGQLRDIEREVPGDAVGADSYWELLDQLQGDSGTPSRAARCEEALVALITCVQGLSDAHRQVIQLRFLEGLPVADVALRLGKSEPAIVALTKRALQALRSSMDRLGEFTHGA